jgi:hypothetical protein
MRIGVQTGTGVSAVKRERERERERERKRERKKERKREREREREKERERESLEARGARKATDTGTVTDTYRRRDGHISSTYHQPCEFHMQIRTWLSSVYTHTLTDTHTHTQLETHKDRPRESAGRLVPGGVALSKSQRLDYDEAFFSVVVDKFGGGIGRTWGLLAGDVGDPAKGLRENSGRNFFNVL